MEQEDMDLRDATMPSRRQFVGGMTAGLVAAFVAPALAQQAAGPPASGPSADPNPVSDPKPPCPRQSQEPPSLASKMIPRPDHGEKSYKGAGRLACRKALVTGGDSGIGRAAAIAYAREGADVAINYLPVEEPDARGVIDLIRAEGRRAAALPGDIREEAFCQQVVGAAVRELGGLDILVNNAAKQHAVDSILELTTEQLDATFKTNLYAMFWITKAAVPHLQPGASIINTASVEAYDPSANLLDYAQTKAAIVAFTKALAKQFAGKGVRVNAVAPGPVWSPLQVSGGQPQDKLETFGGQTPMGRPGQPAELGPIYVLLAAPASSYVTGQVYGTLGGSSNP